MIDAHAHLQFAEFDADRDDVIARAMQAGVRGVVVAGYDSTRRALAAELAKREGLCATAGLHPWAVGERDEAELAALRDLDWAQFAGVGELGLDWVRADSEEARARQLTVFREQLALARALDLPIVLHCVRANDELADVMKKDGVPGRGGLVHSFWGSAEQAKRFVRLGLHLSIGTRLTSARPRRVVDAIVDTGLAHLLVETDAPSRPPADAATTRNEPAYLPCVVDALALVLGTTSRAVAVATEQNARQLFDLRGSLAQLEP